MIDLDGGDAETSDANAATDASEEGITETTTSDNLSCALGATRAHPSTHPSAAAFFFLLGALAIRKRWRKVPAMLALVVPVLVAPIAHAQNTIDADVKEDEPPARHFAIEWNPMSLLVDRYGASIEVLLASHHALVGGAYYVYSATNSDTNNVFSGVGGEIGYRFYLGQNGFRGFYVGPSFLIAALTAQPQFGASVSYLNLGGALDVGWQALVADRVLVGLGAGAQYTASTQSFPQQQVPASVYANSGVRPRVSVAIGVAF